MQCQVEDYFTIVKDISDFVLTTIQFANGDVQLTCASPAGKELSDRIARRKFRRRRNIMSHILD